MAAIDQAAIDKRVQERRAANKKKTAERKAARAEKRASKKAAKAEKKVGKKWTKAVKKQKKTGGSTMTELIKRRNAAEKGSAAYASAQNKINKAYGSKKVHKAAPKKAAKPDVRKIVKSLKKTREKKPAGPSPTWGVGESKAAGPVAPKSVGGKEAWKAPEDKYRTKKQLGGMVTPPGASPASPSIQPPGASYDEGGKVESNPYGWPTRDARSGLSKKK
jgi:hypothetical protein|tara:strand:- start:466 stop:1122 length:657 start_codon:yes stop_codon:yes gene_type:complete